MNPITLKSIPGELSWKNEPVFTQVKTGNSLDITAGPESDWFHNPGGNSVMNNAPMALFAPSGENFILSAKVTVEFQYTFDAGVLFIYVNEETWAKLCFEYSPQNEAMVVSVVTRGRSDDCNSTPIGSHSVYLRVFRQANAIAFHYSTDGQSWHFVRYFTIGDLSNLKVGFAAQSPVGKGCPVHFSEIDFRYASITDLRDGT
jgi:regulation of enolase protein 1 (concanavalin A-like superfamily)